MADDAKAPTVLGCLDRLEVGPIELTAQRLRAPYTVTVGGRTERTELVYKWEEPVFEPDDPASRNLACMVAAQVALNYGLFCREIRFVGLYDRHDRRFLEDMARNTAREIFVHKLLLPNPFLVPSARELVPERLPDYLVATLQFEPGPGDEVAAAKGWEPLWRGDRSRHAILSSGGKDSLLTYGLLQELGHETHPIYVNESGRHWYTALNAYRHFAQEVPNTARVWTSADRVFAWMLRQLPFVRQDFARLRADDYPVRLWTVAVFLFGALPLLARRSVGRLLIGDEYDTTVRQTYRGITHYHGLYDQSRYFDDALSRYFGRKGFEVAQFSLLRPCSELLIQKILVQRYPDLAALQVSCHAAHLDGERALPCGRCEKCRRIVAMVTAVDVDPALLGYPPDLAAEALQAVAAHGVHQELAGARQLASMLDARGLLPEGKLGVAQARPCPEVLSLRFDSERSPVDWVPNELRWPLVELLLQHAEGALRRSGRVWVELDPRGDELSAAPYRFERPRQGPAAGPRGAGAPVGEQRQEEPSEQGPRRPYLLAELTWPEARDVLRSVDVALLPVGAIEQHGPHLPLDVDAYDASRLCLEVAQACSAPRPLVLPGLPYGVSYHHEDFPGTIGLSPDTLSALVYEIGMAVARQGIAKLVIINGHGGNDPALHFAAQKINRDARIFTCVESGETSDPDIEALAETRNDVHAGEIETSTALATRPELVHMERAQAQVPTFSSRYLEFSSQRSVNWYVRTARLSRSGVMGDPTRASAEKGRRMWAVMVRNLVQLVEHIKELSLDSVYQRRY